MWQFTNRVTGHTIGFGHAHERPDADDHVLFNCRALTHHEDAKALVECTDTIDEPAFTAEMSLGEKMSLVLVFPLFLIC
jgi:hypothetical protein